MNRKTRAKYYKAMNFEFDVVKRLENKPSGHEFWRRLDAITNVALFDHEIGSVDDYMKLVHCKERLSEAYKHLNK